ncbi:MAG: alpha/beta hydrolase [Gammaproteobacteria bacterium]
MIEEALVLNGQEQLEARFAYAEDLAHPSRAVLLCPPHPFLGGDLDNNVVRALAESLADAGCAVLRFNYRGIGASSCARDLAADEREFWQDSRCPAYEGEIRIDARDAFAALRALLPDVHRFAVVGYSFGCLPALDIAREATLDRLCLVSPPLAKWPIPAHAYALECPRLLCCAPDDFACPVADMERLDASAPGVHALRVFPDADHFFIGHEQVLADAVVAFMEA